MSELGKRRSSDPFTTPELEELKGRIERILPEAADGGHVTLSRLVKWFLIEARLIAIERDQLKETA